ncbi:hypothetical protein [Bradyrhizobium sp. I1.14.4]|uniref:hypothetical protein n=1 Tax=unclassified Bradyrhizobium TaxID=2631580 RepID=UPI003D1BE6EB
MRYAGGFILLSGRTTNERLLRAEDARLLRAAAADPANESWDAGNGPQSRG